MRFVVAIVVGDSKSSRYGSGRVSYRCLERTVTIPQPHRYFLGRDGAGRNYILFTISVEIDSHNIKGIRDSGGNRRLKGAITVADQNAHAAAGGRATHE